MNVILLRKRDKNQHSASYDVLIEKEWSYVPSDKRSLYEAFKNYTVTSSFLLDPNNKKHLINILVRLHIKGQVEMGTEVEYNPVRKKL